jgi:D-threonate/D-erythronate kinase
VAVGMILAIYQWGVDMIVIADDLTGANDTAVQYQKCGVSSIVIVSLLAARRRSLYKHFTVISINTDSRALQPADAYRAVYRACSYFCTENTSVYKKVDSVFRGNPGIELVAAMDALKCDIAFVAPSYPENGRIVRDGILSAGGQEIPAVDSISADTQCPVCSVPLVIVAAGDTAIATFLEKNRSSGRIVFVFDACTDNDLNTIYRAVHNWKERFILCGSAGLAHFDAVKKAENESYAASFSTCLKKTNGLIVVLTGSRNKETKMQYIKASEEFHIPFVVIDKTAVSYRLRNQVIRSCLEEIEKQVRQGNKIILIAISSLFDEFHLVLRDSEKNYRMARALAGCLGKLAARIYKRYEISGFISNGGDTTLQLCKELGVQGIRPVAEVVPGVPVGILAGGRADGVPVITKSGGFGAESVLCNCITFLNR